MLSLALTGVEVGFPGLDTPALSIPRLSVAAGGQLAIAGPSGSGKSTLVNVITGLERPGAGQVLWNGTDIARLPESARDRWRGANVGLVMQDFHLFPGLSALENTLLPARLARVADRTLADRAAGLLAEVGLHRPAQKVETMSRGEMQRVAVARALLRRPGVIVADEPTASLDPANGAAIGALLVGLARRSGATLIVVSHDPALIALLPRRLTLAGGVVHHDVTEPA
ncbi:MAG TPA: ATP-binding cassette domain-containing protein [Paracoccus solventivorans]|uniref:ABC transporter ATP-binding protein n=1 Tax=Paracoccus solventivorans TaxID=53463 RepID=UPI002CE6A1D6|nr:ATP-binding cassette domain-containing protein [Paracoccus solventivorans]HMM09807.1 ATP-binding cassette domain-containing protein [Paracoccus solventivorans]